MSEDTVLCVELGSGIECEITEAKRAFLSDAFAEDALVDFNDPEEVSQLFDQHWLVEPIDARVLVLEPSNAKRSGNRKRFRGFSLKAMLLVVSLLAISLGPYAAWYSKVERQRKAVEQMVDSQDFAFDHAELSKARFPWLRKQVYGDQAFGDVVSISFMKEIPDCVADLPELSEVAVFERVTDLSNLAKIHKLRTIQMAAKTFDTVEPLRGMKYLEEISCENSSVADLSPLEQLPGLRRLCAYDAEFETGPSNIPNLEYFRADDSPLHDASGLATCPKLENVSIEGTNVKDLAWAKNLRKLKVLRIGGTPIEDLSPLAGKLDLDLQGLESTRVADFTPLAGFKTLTYVSLPQTARKVDAIGTWPKLYELKVEKSPIKQLPDLSGTNIELVDISDTPIESLGFLKNVKELNSLELNRVPLDDLSGLPQVENLKLCQTEISDLGVLSTQRKIHHLEIANSPIADLSPLAALTKLEQLDIELKGVTKFDCVATMPILTRLRLTGLPKGQVGLLTTMHLKRLVLPGIEITSCEKLPARTLQVLDLSNSKVNDISAIADQRDLRMLSLRGTSVSDISSLEQCNLITDLDLGDTDVSDLAAIRTMWRLSVIELSGSNVTDISALAGINGNPFHLGYIGLSYMNAVDLSPLAQAISSRSDTVDLSRNEWIDFSQLSEIRWLGELNLSKTNLKSFAQLGEMQYSIIYAQNTGVSKLEGIAIGVQILDISHTNVTDLSPLYECESLRALHIEGLDISNERVAELKERLPNCNVFREMAVPTTFSTEGWLDVDLYEGDLP